MIRPSRTTIILSCTVVAMLVVFPINASASVDVDAAKATARSNGCLKCHGETKDKDGPSYKRVAEKYRGKEGAEEKLIHHVTAGAPVKFPDGHEENHKIIETKDDAEIKNVIDWILSIE